MTPPTPTTQAPPNPATFSDSPARSIIRVMAKAYEVPPGVEIAALKNKKTTGAGGLDLMRPGDGTPWEDRGAQGLVKAFVQTCVKSITSPGLLLDHIRRPDTSREGTQFAIGCSVLWGLSVAIHTVLYHYVYTRDIINDIGPGPILIKALILGAVIGALVYVLLVMFANRMYYAMVSTELKNTAPRVLLYNMFCYCLGPSILAPIPVIGPPAALLLIFMDWIVGGSKRLYITYRGGIVAACLTMIAALAMGSGALWAANLVANNVLEVRPEPVIDHDPMSPTFGQPIQPK
jgi:hypothetical protein